jgi:hypothetical protein
MFGAIDVDPNPRQHHVFSEVHAVDEQRDQLEPA